MNNRKEYKKNKSLLKRNKFSAGYILIFVFFSGFLFFGNNLHSQITYADTTSPYRYFIFFNYSMQSLDQWENKVNQGDLFAINFDPKRTPSNGYLDTHVIFFPEVTAITDSATYRGIDTSNISLYFYNEEKSCWNNAEFESAIRGDTLEILRIRKKYGNVTYETTEFCEQSEQILTPSISDYLTDLKITSTGVLGIDTSKGTITFNEAIPGYYPIVYNSEFCLQKYGDTITINPKPEFQIERQREICEGQSIELIPVTNGVYDYNWSDGSSSNKLVVTQPGNYAVTAINEFECTRTDTVKIDLKRLELNNIQINTDDADCYNDGRIDISNIEVRNAVGPVHFSFENKVSGLISEDTNMLREGEYNLIIEDSEGCKTVYQQPVKIKKDCLNDYPVFSPNVDGQDDDYYVPYEGEAVVYDRNGIEVGRFMAPAYWEGKDESGNPLPMGNYLIVVNKKEIINITIIK